MLSAGCTLPRGAALNSEVLRDLDSSSAPVAVVPVTRATLAEIAAWPAPLGVSPADWIGAGQGSDSGLIRVGDTVNVTIWDNQDNSLLVPPGTRRVELSDQVVTASGTIFLPYVGDVRINGQTIDQARSTIQDRLTAVSPSAQVLLAHTAGQQNSYSIVTGTARPGTFPMQGRNVTILSALAEGGGIDPSLRNPVIRLIRGATTYEISSDRLLSDARQNVALRGGDKIVVQADSRYFTSLGATGSEKLIPFEQDRITALEAVSIMGGLADNRANPKGLLVLRDYPTSAVRANGPGPRKAQVVFTLDLTSADGLFSARSFLIQPRDTVMATESSAVTLQTILGIFGSAIGVANAANDN